MQVNVDRWVAAIGRNPWLIHAACTGLAVALAFGIAGLFGLSEAYWAPISTLIVTQSTLGAAWAVSKQRLVGTVLGAVFGAVLASYVAPSVVTFGVGVFVLGLLCGVLRLDQAAYRFAGVTLAIVLLVTRKEAAWLIGLHRLVEVSLGIGVGLAVSAVWPAGTILAEPRRPTRG